MALYILHFTQISRAPIRLDELLASMLPEQMAKLMKTSDISKTKIRRLIIAGAVTINGQQERIPAKLISQGSTMTVRLDTEKFTFEKQPDDISFEMTEDFVLYEDNSIIVVNKPAGFPTEATIVASRDHLHASVKRYLALRDKTRNEPYVGLHHRLDRETSGVILFTKDRKANGAVHEMFLFHHARKEYEALTAIPTRISSNPKTTMRQLHEGDVFSVDNFLGRISPKSAAGKWGAVTTGGDPAHTDFRVLEEVGPALRIQAMPLTGRTHQIRVHLAGEGLPILGDALYGGPHFLGNYRIPRIMLHAARLSFPHPLTGIEMTIEAPYPDDFKNCLATLSNSFR